MHFAEVTFDQVVRRMDRLQEASLTVFPPKRHFIFIHKAAGNSIHFLKSTTARAALARMYACLLTDSVLAASSLAFYLCFGFTLLFITFITCCCRCWYWYCYRWYCIEILSYPILSSPLHFIHNQHLHKQRESIAEHHGGITERLA